MIKSSSPNDATLKDLTLADIVSDTEAAAKANVQRGQKIVGYISNAIPLEIIDACGSMPLHLCGDVNRQPTLANEFMERAFDPITRSIFDRILKGDYNFLDLIVLPRCNDAQQRLYYYLCEIKRKFPQYPIPPIFLLNILHTPWPSSEDHNLKQVYAFADRLGELTGKTIDDNHLSQAIERYNMGRQQLKTFTQLRSRKDKTVSANISHQVYTAARSLEILQFNSQLSQLNSELEQLESTQSNLARIVLAGNGVDHPQVHQLMDNVNINVVGDYHSLGNHFLVGHIDNNEDPLKAITRHYHRHTLSSRSFLPDPQWLINFCQQQNADGILFYFLQGEEALTWQVPEQQRLATSAGLPSCIFYDQPYGLNEQEVVPKLKSFMQSLTLDG